METEKVTIMEGDVAVITCPFCFKTRRFLVGNYREAGKRTLKVKCGCNKVFSICLESRRHERKAVSLLGQSINLTNHSEEHDIFIENISLGGLGFCPFKKHQTRKDDLLQISFILNDTQNTLIDTNVTVRSSADNHVGCEFNSTDNFKAPLGFLLSPGSSKIE